MIDKRLLESVRDVDTLVDLFRGDEPSGLGWKIKDPEFAFEDVSEIAKGLKIPVTVSRLIPTSAEDKRLILLAEFQSNYKRSDLRSLLVSLRRHNKLTARWSEFSGIDDTIFIVTYLREGQSGYADVRFVYFSELPGRQPTIRSFGWKPGEPTRTIREWNLPRLAASSKMPWDAAWDVEALTKDFFSDYDSVFRHFRDSELPATLSADQRHYFTQNFFNRIMFCWFLQRKEWLNGDLQYIRNLYLDAREKAALGHIPADKGTNYYADYLHCLFFRALNTPSEKRPDYEEWVKLKDTLGRVPFLNGGLFDPRDNLDAKGAVVIRNSAFEPVLTLFEKYNFTVEESTPDTIEVAVDPEMLGRVFEKLVTSRTERQAKGSYYTPRSIVTFMCREALKGFVGGYEALIDNKQASNLSIAEAKKLLDVLHQVRVVDPACGSGAYLLGMLRELFDLIEALELRLDKPTAQERYRRKLAIIENNLYGVDLDKFAVNIARLRLWLSLAVDYDEKEIEELLPLPNLDYKIEDGDSLSGPDPRIASDLFRSKAEDIADEIDELKHCHFTETGPEKELLGKQIDKLEETLTEALYESGAKIEGFDWRVRFARVFISRGKENAHGSGFDIVLANPPYGEGAVSVELRDRLFGLKSGQSKDIYAAFLARAFHLLAPGGMMSYITSNTWRTIRTHRPLRKLVLKGTILHVIDVPEWVFDAVVRTCVLTLRNGSAPENHRLCAADLMALQEQDWATLDANLTAIAGHGPDVQTLTYARYTYPQDQVLKDSNAAIFIARPSLQRFFTDNTLPRLGDGEDRIAEVAVGLQTGDNGFYLRKANGGGGYSPVDPSLVLHEDELVEFASRSTEERLEGIDTAEFSGRHFVPYDKGGESDLNDGGWLPCFFVPTEFFIDWSTKAVHRLKTATVAECKTSRGENGEIRPGDEKKIASRFQNASLYFQPGITYSRTGRYSPTYRISSGYVFDTKSCFIGCDESLVAPVLGVLNSRPLLLLAKCFLNNGWGLENDDVKRLPILLPHALELLANIVRSIVKKQEGEPRYPYWLNEGVEIDSLVSDTYALSPEEVRDVELWYCRYERGRLARARSLIEPMCKKHADHLAWCEEVMSKPPGYWRSHPLLALIAKGESQVSEFKETFGWSVKENKKDDGVVHSSLKNVAAFLNTDGGKLLIGVHDNGSIMGLEPDYKSFSKGGTWDALQLHIKEHISKSFDPDPLGTYVSLSREILPEGEVCVVSVKPRPRPAITYLKSKKDGKDVHEIYVRDGNRAIALEGKKRDDWLKERHAPGA